MIRRRFKHFMPERAELSATGEETLLSVSEYYGVKPRSEAFDADAAEGRAESLEGYRKVRVGDFVMNYMLAWKGAYGVSEFDGIVSPAYAVYEINPKYADRRYIHHRLRSGHMRAEFRARSKGIIESRLRLYPDAFLSMAIDLPDLETQKAIADFLDRETARVDSLVQKKLQMLTLTSKKFDNKVRALIAQGEALAPSQPLHRFCKIVTGKTPSREEAANFSDDDGLLWATPANLGEFDPIVSTKEKLTATGRVGQVVVPSGTVLINGIGASIGKIGLAGCEMSFNQQIHGIIQRKPLLRGRFLFYVMRTRKDEIVSLASNTTIPIINADRFGRIRVPLSPDRFQEGAILELDEALLRVKKLSEAVARSVERLSDFRTSLITSVVTGQIDVDTWSKRGNASRQLDQIVELPYKEARA